jgi:hypothetical protein
MYCILIIQGMGEGRDGCDGMSHTEENPLECENSQLAALFHPLFPKCPSISCASLAKWGNPRTIIERSH